MIRPALLWIIILTFLLPGTSFAALKGMVRHVYDGDTLLLLSRTGSSVKIRLYGIDAPEAEGQPYGAAARRVLMYKVLGRVVDAEVRERDRYGRTVAVIRLGRRDINAEMVSEGMAWTYRQYLSGPYSSDYIRLEELARRHRKGLWRQPNPQPPWEYRHAGTKGKRRH